MGCRIAHAVSGSGQRTGLLDARLLCAGILAMGVMTFSLVLHSIDLHADGNEHGLVQLVSLGRVALALLALPVLALLVPPLAGGAWLDLRSGRVRMDGLIVLAVSAAYLLSSVNAWRGAGEVYFDTATMVLVLVTLGRRLEAHSRAHARSTAEALADVLPARATRLPASGAHQEVDPSALRAGDRVRVAPGESVPADARVLHGHSALVTALVSGEEAPREVRPGDSAPAGALNTDGALELRVEAAGGEGSLARLRQLLDAPLQVAPALRTADRLAGVLSVVAAALALAGGLHSGMQSGLADGLRTALSVLLVACPCALGLATPLAYRALRSALARRGVLVNDAAALERAARVDHVVFDKTGTLTEPLGRFELLPGADAEVWQRGAALIAASGHPLARGTCSADDSSAVSALRVTRGAGVQGRVGAHELLVGRADWLAARGVRLDPDLSAALDTARAAGDTLVSVAENGVQRAAARLAQRVRPGVHECVDSLRARGLELEILSGDASAAARALGRELALPARGDASPSDKHARLAELRGARHSVLMLGDGMNDAPALRLADVGVALASGTSLARSQAHIELVHDDPRALLVLLDAARALRRTVRGNLFWTLSYNAVALALAASGRLPPLAAVVAMIASSLAVSWRSQKLLSWRPTLAPALSAPRAATAPTPRAMHAEGARA
ncbi:MAG: copper-translocating P-type ATPase [Planctomycetota bacterium]|nr:MAG: copper-translocating P-type ATPase [Planctomycetota bacterium]